LDDVHLSPRARSLLLDRQNSLYLSAASAWEIVIKYQSGKLRLPDSPEHFVRQCLRVLFVDSLSITLEHTLRVETLPSHHRDPFDRILIAQAQAEDLAILTNDKAFADYPVTTLW
jgi:PIN domain nuclease of toxin-antitoxin system